MTCPQGFLQLPAAGQGALLSTACADPAGGGLIMLGCGAEQQPRLWEKLEPLQEAPSSHIDKCRRQELRSWADRRAVFNAPLGEVLSGAEDCRNPQSKSEILPK